MTCTVHYRFPNSSISETVHVVEDYSPPPSSMDMRKEDVLSPPPYPGFVRVNHHRNHSVSSTASSQMYRKPEYLRSPTEPFHHMDTSDSAYGGSAEKGVNHLYHEIPPPPPRCNSAIGGGEHHLVSNSFPSVSVHLISHMYIVHAHLLVYWCALTVGVFIRNTSLKYSLCL